MCVFAGAAFTCAAENIHVVTANLTDGTSVDFKVSENPVTSFSDDGVRISTADTEVTYPFDRFDFLTFGVRDTSPAADVAGRLGRPLFHISGRLVEARDLPAGASVTILDVRGSVRFAGKASAAGTLYVDMSDVPVGVYVLESDVAAFKFLIR